MLNTLRKVLMEVMFQSIHLRTVIMLHRGSTSEKSQPLVLIFTPALEKIEHS